MSHVPLTVVLYVIITLQIRGLLRLAAVSYQVVLPKFSLRGRVMVRVWVQVKVTIVVTVQNTE